MHVVLRGHASAPATGARPTSPAGPYPEGPGAAPPLAFFAGSRVRRAATTPGGAGDRAEPPTAPPAPGSYSRATGGAE